MKRILALIFALFFSATTFAQETVDPADVIQSATQFLDENLDDSTLDALGIDADRVRKFLRELEQQFQGEYIFDLSASRETALQILPVLEQFEETQPYAVWLKSRLDYFDVANKLRPKISPEKMPARLPAPSPKQERQAWIEVVEERPMPPLAFKQVLPLKKIFIAERVPPELVWVAEVESSFDSRAKSPAGAAGLFQLMPVTARGQNLEVGFFRDERLHPEKNARAAAQYLRHLHARFGDWRLALAAYNAGETRVANLLKSQKAKTYDAIANRLPAETQLYVPKVEAIIHKREGRALADLKVK